MNRIISFILISLISADIFATKKEILPYKDNTLSVEQRVNDLLGRMTLEEKLAQIRHIHSWHIFNGQQLDEAKLAKYCGNVSWGFFEGFPLTAANCRKNFRQIQTYLVEKTRLGIPAFAVGESLHGIVHEGATIFPQNIAMGSTFNPTLAKAKTRCISGELNTIGIKQVFAPCIDVVRDLRWGRVEESFGEDPFLCGLMSIAEVQGYLENGISPMLKHYGPHGNPVGGLNLASVDCGVRDLFDIYLKPFEMTIQQTGIMAVMSSYNSWNRTPNSASRFMLTDILRHRFGFRGYVYSDWGVIGMLKTFHETAANDGEAATQALKAGLDVEASSNCYAALQEMIENGKFDVNYIDQAVKRVLRSKIELGLFEDPYAEDCSYKLELRAKENVKLSKEIADESTVLLKNEGNLLPLRMDKWKSIAVIGPNADQVQFGDYTWSKKNTDGITPLQGIKKIVGNKMKINYAKGCSLASLDQSGIAEAVEAARNSDIALIFVGSSSTAFVRYSQEPSTSGEGMDLNDISLTGAQQQLIEAVEATGKPVVVILVAGKPFAIPWIKEHIPAIVVQWYAGEQAGTSIADILFGQVNPSGKLTFSFPQSTGHLPVYYNYLTTDKGYYHSPGSYKTPGRDYVFSSPAPLWAFGYGLSYTTFKYISAVTDKQVYHAHDTISISVKVKNTGSVFGKEVVQVYVRDIVSSTMTPIKQLKGFNKVSLASGEEKTCLIKIPVHELYLTDDFGNHYLEEGAFDLQVGTASDCIYHKLRINVGETTQQIASSTVKIINTAKQQGRLISVKGILCDAQATPISGVCVTVEGEKTNIYTDSKGAYFLKAGEHQSLLFSKAGYVTKRVLIDGQRDLNVQLVNGE